MPTKTTKKTAAAQPPVDGAGVPAEYRDQLRLTALVKHPKNPRHQASADTALVDSVRATGIIQPLVVAPIGNEDKFVLIAGHRRLDAAKKARRKTVPVVIRRDLSTEGQQIEAMLVENGRRVDLTPVEEAEGYAQLELLGYKPPAIAKAVGRDVKTVKSRLELLKLSASTRKRVHAGQLHLNDAAAMVEFADDPDQTKRLEQAARASDGWSFKQELSYARRRRDRARDVAARTAKLLDAGATELTLPDDTSLYSWAREGGRAPLESTHSTDWGQHKTCLAFVIDRNEYHGHQLQEICTDPQSHRADLDAEAQRRADEAEARIKADEERSLAEAAAADGRVATLMDLAEGITVADVLGDLVRTLLPIRIRDLSGDALDAYQQAMRIPAEDRWPFLGYHHTKAIDLTRFAQHVDDLAGGGNSLAARALSAFLVAQGEYAVGQGWYLHHNEQALGYFDLLTEAGHAMSPIDTEQRAEHQAKLDEAAAKSEKKAS